MTNQLAPSFWTALLSKGIKSSGVLQPSRSNLDIIGGTFVDDQATDTLHWTPPTGSSTVTGFFFAALLALSTSGLSDGQVQHLDGYRAKNDGGEGWLFWDSASTETADQGSIILPTGHVGAGRWKRAAAFGRLNVCWYGADATGGLDSTTVIQSVIAIAQGQIVYFPTPIAVRATGAVYAVTSTVTISQVANQIGITLIGDSTASGIGAPFQPVIAATMSNAFSATTGSIASVAAVAGRNWITTVTFPGGVTVPTWIKPGMGIQISNATSTDGNGKVPNNNYFTIYSVTTGAGGSIAYIGFSPIYGAASGNPIAPDANNGNIHVNVTSNILANYSEYTHLENLGFRAITGVHACVYSTVPVSGGGTNGGNTKLTVRKCNFAGGVLGIDIGDCATDAGTNYPCANCELTLCEDSYFVNQLQAGFAMKGYGGQQKQECVRRCAFANMPIGILNYNGSLNTGDLDFTTVTNMIWEFNPTDVAQHIGIHAEGGQHLYVTGLGQGSNGTTPYNCMISGVRWDFFQADLDAQHCLLWWQYNGGLTLIDCEFGIGGGNLTAQPTIFLAGHQGGNQSSAVIIGCSFNTNYTGSNLTPPEIVTAGTGQATSYFSLNNTLLNNQTGISFAVPDLYHWFNASAGAWTSMPPANLFAVCTPPASVAIANNATANIDLANTHHQRVLLTGGGSSAVLLGQIEGYPDEVQKLVNTTGASCGIAHEDTTHEATPTRRYHTLTGATVNFTAWAEIRYDSTLNRWLVEGWQ